MGWLHLAATTRIIQTMPATDQKQARVWNRWITYLGTVNRAGDPFLEALDSSEAKQRLKPVNVSGFAQALRTGQLQTSGRKSVVASTVKDNIGLLVQAFRASRRPEPTRDPDGRLSSFYQGNMPVSRVKTPHPSEKKPSAFESSSS
jgi:hypothetical protein